MSNMRSFAAPTLAAGFSTRLSLVSFVLIVIPGIWSILLGGDLAIGEF